MPRRAPRPALRRPLARRLLAGAAAALLLAGLTACAPSTPDATLRVLTGTADVDGSRVDGSVDLESGDVIEVEGDDPVVEIAWADGSFTRLGDGSRFTIGGDEVRGELTTGVAWNAVGPAAVGFGISTPGGIVAAAVDTSFALRCDGPCDGVVATGSVRVATNTITAPSSFAFTGEVSPVSWDAIYGDPFALANAERDAAAGLADPAVAWAGRMPSLASLAGEFEGATAPVTQTCTGWAEECAHVESNLFADDAVTFDFVQDCDVDGACTMSLRATNNQSGGGTTERLFPLAFDGVAYTMSQVVGEDAYCFFDDGRTEGRYLNTLSATLTPLAAEIRGGAYVVTSLSAELDSRLELAEATTDPTCAEFEYEWVNAVEGTLDLVDGSSTAAPALDLTSAAPPRPIAGLARPSVLSELRSPLDAIPTLPQLGLLAGGILVVALVLGYPAYLLSRVVADRYDRVAGSRAAAARERIDARPVLRVVLLVLGVAVAALITAALDPGFGASFASVPADPSTIATAAQSFLGDVGSWRVVLTALASFVVFLGVGSLVVRLAGRGIAPGVRMPLEFRWGSLLILLAGVVVSRVFDITPGIIFGLVAGLAIADSIPKAGRGRLALVAAVFALVTGALAWTGYAFVAPLADAAPTDVVLVTATELLSALTLEAVSTLPLAFLPVLGLDGFPLRAWRVVAWLGVYILGLALFVLVLLSLPGSWTEIEGDGIRWLIGFGAFTVVSVVIYLIHRALENRRATREAAAAPVADTGDVAPQD